MKYSFKRFIKTGIILACTILIMPISGVKASAYTPSANSTGLSRAQILKKTSVLHANRGLNKKMGVVFKKAEKKVRFFIDISKWQTPSKINYRTLAKQIDGAILRIGTGDRVSKKELIKDIHFDRHYSALRDKGVPMGVYWYSCAVNYDEGVEEAKEALKILGDRKLDLPIYFDTEDRNFQYKAWKLDKSAITQAAKGFCETIENSGRKAGIYASASWLNHQMNMKELSSYELWVANYVGIYNFDKPPVYNGQFKMWQYSSKLKLKGFNDGPIDSNWRY